MILRATSRSFAFALALSCVAAAATSGLASGNPPGALASWRVDPALATAARMAPADSFAVWVRFGDKGEQGPADLAARLAGAEAALTPRARARRLRAGVQPLVDERDLPVPAAYLEALAARGLPPIAVSRWLDQAAVRLPGRRLEEIAALPFVSSIGPVEKAVRAPDVVDGAALAPRPARAGTAGATTVDEGLMVATLSQIDVVGLHQEGWTGAGVLVAVLDDGFNWFTRHEAFGGLVIPPERQYDFVRGVAEVQDTTNAGMDHGTLVLGCLAGRKLGTYVGAAFGADYALARTENDASETPQEMLFWGMGAEWADSLGADVISSSLAYSTFDKGYPSYTYANMDGHTTVVSQAAEIAASKGLLVVNAVGNYGTSAWHYLAAPADVNGDSLIAVGAVDATGAVASFSSYGPSADGRVKPDLAARGVSVPLVVTNGQVTGYQTGDGTSFSTPQIAGLAALLMQAHPTWKPLDVIHALRGTASRANAPDNRVGYGIPNGLAALAFDTAGVAPSPRLSLRRLGGNPVRLAAGPVSFLVGLTAGLASCSGQAASLEIFDTSGRLVGRPWSGVLPCGNVRPVAWDGRDRAGRRCGAGLYVVRLRSATDRASLRLTCLP